MITRIREVRRARGMTLDDVAKACSPPTTPQTIGRLETGTRTVSIVWLNRIADALGVDAADLVEGGGERAELPVVAVLGAAGASAPKRTGVVVAPRPKPGQVAITVLASNGDYRAGDEIWCDTVEADGFTVVCADGRFKVTRVQADGPKIAAGEWAASAKLATGARFT